MATESIYALRRPGFPKDSLSADAYRTIIEYVGISTDLGAATPGISSPWGEYPGLVVDYSLDPFEGRSDFGILTVVVERKFDTGGDDPKTGTKIANQTTYEIDWTDVERSLYVHPVFAVGGSGAYALTSEDVHAIALWEKNPDLTYKQIYTYREDGDYSNGVTSADPTLTANAKMFARGIELGIEVWVDKAPVAKRSDTWVKGPPPSGTAGQKQEPTGFPNLPDGYEWIRSADRALREGGQSAWTNSTEWLGSKKWLVDVDEIYWTAPA